MRTLKAKELLDEIERWLPSFAMKLMHRDNTTTNRMIIII